MSRFVNVPGEVISRVGGSPGEDGWPCRSVVLVRGVGAKFFINICCFILSVSLTRRNRPPFASGFAASPGGEPRAESIPAPPPMCPPMWVPLGDVGAPYPISWSSADERPLSGVDPVVLYRLGDAPWELSAPGLDRCPPLPFCDAFSLSAPLSARLARYLESTKAGVMGRGRGRQRRVWGYGGGCAEYGGCGDEVESEVGIEGGVVSCQDGVVLV